MSKQRFQQRATAAATQDTAVAGSEQIVDEIPTVLDQNGRNNCIPIFSEFFTKPQLANELKRNPRTLDRWNSLGTGPPRTVIGRMVLYRRTSVVKWLKAQERQGSAS